jgi:hypothetical protein
MTGLLTKEIPGRGYAGIEEWLACRIPGEGMDGPRERRQTFLEGSGSTIRLK